jgi:hypothetical protein
MIPLRIAKVKWRSAVNESTLARGTHRKCKSSGDKMLKIVHYPSVVMVSRESNEADGADNRSHCLAVLNREPFAGILDVATSLRLLIKAKMTKEFKIGLFAMTILLATAATAKVKVIVEAKGDLSQYRTYQWLPPRVLKKTGLEENDDVVAPVIKAAVNKQLAKLGLTEAPANADVQISAWAFRQASPQVEAYVYGSYDDWYFGGTPATLGRYNNSGTLVIGLIDPKTKKSVWGALSTGSFEKPSQLESRVNKAASEIFGKYPRPKSR